ncbi:MULTISPECIES: transposase [Pontibacillus]|uniref:Transposase n=1 Tax=Pontibacillus chungwhensis TaxID=265426 RepID=A0ABY8V1Q3_9BACI|nr:MULTISPECIES: transposase [Pontibacillus]MCD5324146.1 transposase [Pontibacillus sp. HN14]WIF97796.1 transposase [Pontibacillus chungwhensis]
MNGVYHIMLRGINQQTIFEEEEDRSRFLETLRCYKDVSGYKLYGYCLMDNHVHLLLKEEEEPVSLVLKRISSSYIYWYNMKYDRCGPLFQGRYRSETVEDPAYFIIVLRYIHQNPLKAGLVKSVWDGKWTSCKDYVQEKETFIDKERALQLFSDDWRKAIQQYVEFMQKENKDHCLEINGSARITDQQLQEQLRNMGIPSSSLIQKLNQVDRDEVLSRIKEIDGVSIRQPSRVTGIPRRVINRL